MFSGINGTGYITRGTADPTAGSGVNAPLGVLYQRATGGAGTLYQKTGTGATDWTLVVSASFTGDLAVTGGITATTTIAATGTVTGSRLITTTAGTAAAPAVAVNDGTDAAHGLYCEAADTLSLTGGGVRYMRVKGTSVDVLNTPFSPAQHTIAAGVQSSELSATTNDLALTAVDALRLTTSGGAQNLTSLTNGTAGREIWIENNNAVGGDNVVLVHDDGASGTAANRFSFSAGGNITMAPQSALRLKYSGSTSRWQAARA